MEEALNNLILSANEYHAPAVLAVLGGLLILADYYFDTDVPAHFGYVCFAIAAFLMGPALMRESILVGLLVWSLLLNVHFMYLREVLASEPDSVKQADSPPA